MHSDLHGKMNLNILGRQWISIHSAKATVSHFYQSGSTRPPRQFPTHQTEDTVPHFSQTTPDCSRLFPVHTRHCRDSASLTWKMMTATTTATQPSLRYREVRGELLLRPEGNAIKLCLGLETSLIVVPTVVGQG